MPFHLEDSGPAGKLIDYRSRLIDLPRRPAMRYGDPVIVRRDDLFMARSAAFPRLSPPKNLPAELVDLLSKEITSGKLAPGARLLTEQAMMATFGVSRTVVREAVSALRSEGLVLTRQGVGAFVATDRQKRPFRIDQKDPKSVT